MCVSKVGAEASVAARIALLAACVLAACNDGPTESGPAVASVVVDPSSATVQVGSAIALAATVTGMDGDVLTGRTVVWSSSNDEIASVNAAGLVTGHRVGSAQIAASAGGESGIAAIQVTRLPITSVTISPNQATVPVGQTRTLTVTARDAQGNPVTDRPASWSSSNGDVASVSSTGVVTARRWGSATISAVVDGVTGTAVIDVPRPPITSVTISPDRATVPIGQTRALTATARDAQGNTVTDRPASWSSSNENVVSVSSSGVVTARWWGSATISAVVDGVTGTAVIEVPFFNAAVARVEVEPSSATLEEADDEIQLTAVLFDALNNVLTGREVSWSSSDNKKCTVTSTGRVRARDEGTCVITATSEGKQGKATIRVEDD